MGFWQIGYYEFHEPVGFEGILVPLKPVKNPCQTCQSEFDSLDELKHSIVDHQRFPDLTQGNSPTHAPQFPTEKCGLVLSNPAGRLPSQVTPR